MATALRLIHCRARHLKAKHAATLIGIVICALAIDWAIAMLIGAGIRVVLHRQ
jgi:hypothetical protein